MTKDCDPFLEWQAVATMDALSEGQAIAVEVNGRSVLMVQSNGSAYAIARHCSHADQDLECGIVRSGWIACPAHGARFDLATGEPLGPPATSSIATFPIRIRDGVVEVQLGGAET